MVGVLINPGSGPVDGGTLKQAQANMAAFLTALNVKGATAERTKARAHNGRWTFKVSLHQRRAKSRHCVVEMPGVGGLDSKFPLPPRLYVDGSSWFWPFAVRQCRDALTGSLEDGT